MDFEILSDSVDQYVSFYIGIPGVAGAIAVAWQRGGANAVPMVGPTINEDATVPGWYRVLMNVAGSTTITPGKTTEQFNLWITHAASGYAKELRGQLYKDLVVNTKKMNDVVVQGTGTAIDKWHG